MSKETYIGIDNIARKVTKGYIGVNGTARKIIKAYIGVNGVAKLCWQSGYKNWVQHSINADGTIYNNGLGYKAGYRLSSSGAEKAQTNAVVTGFIPATQNDLIRMSGVSWCPTASSGYSYICFYDASFNKLAHINEYVGGTSNGISNITAGTILTSSKTAHNIVTDENGVTTFNIDYVDGASFSYIRISAEGDGSKMIVTVNQEIEP